MVIMFWLNVAIILSSIPSLAQGHGYLIDRDLIAKKNGFKFNFRSGSGIIKDQGFHSLGCWKDTWIRAIQPLEKRHELLMDGNYKLREDPLRKCAIAALDNNMKLFAIENGGQCLGDTVITTSYMRYGNAEHCKDDGYGGPWSMQVYGFTGRKLKRRHGGYTQWSVWTKCSNKCGEGTQKRHRTCTNPSPTHSGRNCESLGTAMEERSCENECLGTEDDEESDNPDQAHRSTAKSKKTSDDFDDDDEDDDYDDDDDKDETSNTDHAEVSKPPDNTIDSVDKTKSGDLGLKTTSDTTKPNTKIAHYESDSNGANTAGTTNNQFGNTDVNTEQSGLPNGDKSVLAQPDKSSSDASGISDQPVAPLSQGTTDIQPSSTTVNLDQSKSQPSRSESTKENDALAIPPIPKANNKDTDTGKAPGTTDNQPGSTAESNKPSESDDLPPPDDGKSTKEEFPDGETDDDLDEKTKDSTKQADSTTPSDKTDISSSSKGLPDQEQMKAAQDLLRSRWLSLAKTGQLKPTSTEPSVTAVTSPKPVVDVALKDDGVEDFEDKEMQDKPVKEDKQKTDPKKVDDLTKNAGKQEGQEKNVDAPQLNVKKIDEQVTKNDGKLEVQGGNVEGSQLNGKKVDTHVSDPTTDAGKQNEQEMNEEGSQISGKKTEDKVSEETTDSKTEIEQNNNADVLQKNGKKIEDTVNDHSTDGMNQEGQDAEVDDQEDKTNEKDHEKMEGNETVQKEKMDEQQVNEEKTKGKEDDQPEDGSQVVEHGGKVDEKQMEEDNAKGSEGDQSVKEEEMEDQVEGSNDHEEDDSEMKGTDEKVDGNTMDDSHTKMMAQQIGAKRIKEECVCPKVVCLHLADTGMFIDNSNVTDINDLAEMKSFAKGLASGFMTKDEDVQMGIIGNGMGRSRIFSIPTKIGSGNQARDLVTHPEITPGNQARNFFTPPESRLPRQRQATQRFQNANLHTFASNLPKTGSSNQASKRSQLDRPSFIFHPENGHNSQAFKRAEAYLLAKQKKAIPPILNDVLFVLVSGGESDVEVHAPVKEMKDAGAKIVAIAVGKDAKIGELASQADKQFSVPPGAGNAIVNSIITAVCKPDLMGKVMPNPKPCPCTTNPSKKASMTESPRLVQDKAVSTEKRFNAQMTKEEYKTGMFHETVSPKIHISPITPLQKPSSDTTLPTTSSTSLAGNAELTTPPPSGGKLPAPKTSPVIGRAPQSASPVPLSKNMRQNDKVVHIKQGKFKPLSKTLSTLGESINKAHAEGELKEGSDALDNDIHNLLKTIGKLKSQVDVLRNDQTGIASKFPSQSEDTSESAGQSSSTSMSQSTNSYENAEQSQSNTNTVEESDSKADPNKETLLKTKTGSRIPLKLRIIGKTANKKLRNPTILRLKLGGQLKSVQNTAQVKPVQNTAQVKPVQNTAQVKPVQNTAQAKPIVPDPTIHQINTVSTSSVNTVLPQTVSTNTKQPQQTGSPTPAKLVQPETQKATTNGDVNLAQSTNVALKQDQQNTQNIVGTKPTTPTNTATEDIPSQGISTPQTQQDTTSSGSQAVAIANLAPAQLTTTAQAAAISATLPTQSAATLYKTKTFLQDTKTTNPAMHPKTTNNVLQQIITTQKAKPLPLRTQVSPITQSGIATGNTRPPFTNTPNPKAPQQGVTTTQKAEVLPQISPITQSGFTSSTVPHTVSANTAGQLSSTNPGVQRKPKKFVAIESQLARDAATQKKPVHKVLSIPDCNINLGFVLDGSASVEGTSRGNFLKMINFVKDVIHEFVKLSQQVHVGTMVYSTNTSVILSFGTKGTEKVVDQILDSVHYPGQGSLTGKAIKEAWNQMFSSVPRGRKSKLLLLTDGPSNDDIKVPSKWVRDNGVEIFVIGLGKGYDENQLAEMASLPSNGHMMFKDYDDLRTSVQEVRNKVCGFTADEVLQIMTSPGYSDGLREINAFRRNFGTNQCILDVVFLLDGSRQVETNGAGNFQREIDFVKKTVKYLPVSRNDVHVGVGLLGDANVMVFPLNEHYVQNSIDFELNHIRYPASSDIQSEELKYARKLMLMKGARDVATRVFVLVTDVSSIDSYQRAIDELRTEGSDVAMLGVGTSLWRQEVKVRSSVQGLVDQVVSLESGDDNEAAKNFAFNMCKLSNAKKRTEIPGQHWTASNKILNKN